MAPSPTPMQSESTGRSQLVFDNAVWLISGELPRFALNTLAWTGPIPEDADEFPTEEIPIPPDLDQW